MFSRTTALTQIGSIILSGLFLILLTGQDCLAQSDPCNPDPCQVIPNAVADTCTPVGGGSCTPATDFSCSCDAGYTWDGATNTCEGRELEGTWLGNEVDYPEADWTCIVAGDRLAVSSTSGEYLDGTFSLNVGANPKELDYLIAEPPELAGLTALGICDLEGDSVTIAFNAPGNPARPMDFNTGGSSRVFMFTRQ